MSSSGDGGTRSNVSERAHRRLEVFIDSTWIADSSFDDFAVGQYVRFRVEQGRGSQLPTDRNGPPLLEPLYGSFRDTPEPLGSHAEYSFRGEVLWNKRVSTSYGGGDIQNWSLLDVGVLRVVSRRYPHEALAPGVILHGTMALLVDPFYFAPVPPSIYTWRVERIHRSYNPDGLKAELEEIEETAVRVKGREAHDTDYDFILTCTLLPEPPRAERGWPDQAARLEDLRP